MEIDLEDQPLLPPPGWPKLTVRVASAPQSALDLVQQDTMAGKQVCIILAKHVPLVLHRLIWADNYVDLSLLLDKDVSAEQPLQFVTKNSKLALVKSPAGNKIDSWGQWNKAFCFFTEIYAIKYPFKCMQLVQYAGLLNNLAGKFPFYQVYNYDKEFRKELEQVPGLQWNKIDQQLWSTCLHGVNIMSQNQTRNLQQPQQQYCQQQQTEWPFCHCFTHSRGGCNCPSCKFPHICGWCGAANHVTSNCYSCEKVTSYHYGTNPPQSPPALTSTPTTAAKSHPVAFQRGVRSTNTTAAGQATPSATSPSTTT